MSQGLSGSPHEGSAPRRGRSRVTPPGVGETLGLFAGSVAPSPAEPRRASSGRQARSKEASSNVISLSRSRILLWATPRGEQVPYEVSKAVSAPLQARCKTAPLCPAEEGQNGLPGWIRPDDPPIGPCPYEYATRGACICDRNVEALAAALFTPAEARLLGNYLNALGYVVREEAVPPEALDGTRILNAHAKIGDSHDVRVVSAPGVGELVLVRDLHAGP